MEEKKSRVIIESPYGGDVQKNIEYARACLKDSIQRGEAPIASHLLYTQEGVLDDDVPQERELGVGLGFQWLDVCDMHVFYLDLGWSKGMIKAYELSLSRGKRRPYKLVLRRMNPEKLEIGQVSYGNI